jgi:signal recognition particle subunit SRP14
MSKGHLSNDEVGSSPLSIGTVTYGKQFFARLSELFDERRQKDHGSIFLTQKRSTSKPLPHTPSNL